MFRILSHSDFQTIDFAKALEVLSCVFMDVYGTVEYGLNSLASIKLQATTNSKNS